MHKSLKYAKMAVMHARQSRPSQIALANSRGFTLCVSFAADYQPKRAGLSADCKNK
jgi:hypothetical protein